MRPPKWIEREDAREWFLKTVEKTPTCWEWTAYRDREGYGRVTVNRQQRPAYRVAYQLFVGPVPSDMLVLHSCDNPPCVNPEHLRLGSPRDNIQDAIDRGRYFVSVRPPRRAKHQQQVRRFPRNWRDRQDAWEIFMRVVTKDKKRGCWLWQGVRKSNGYGIVSSKGLPSAAHRIAYELFVGPIPPGSHILHACDNPPCVNPKHLHLGSHQDNMREARERNLMRKGENHWTNRIPERLARGNRHRSRTQPESVTRGAEHWSKREPEKARAVMRKAAERARPMGETHGGAKLNEIAVRVLRQCVREGHSFGQLARAYRLCRAVVREAVLGVTWSHIPGALKRVDIRPLPLRVGANHPNARLDEAKVLKMRRFYRLGRSMKELAACFEVSKAVARDAIRGISWKHVPEAVLVGGTA